MRLAVLEDRRGQGSETQPRQGIQSWHCWCADCLGTGSGRRGAPRWLARLAMKATQRRHIAGGFGFLLCLSASSFAGSGQGRWRQVVTRRNVPVQQWRQPQLCSQGGRLALQQVNLLLIMLMKRTRTTGRTLPPYRARRARLPSRTLTTSQRLIQ